MLTTPKITDEVMIRTIALEKMPLYMNTVLPDFPKGISTTARINVMEDVTKQLIVQMGAYVLRSPQRELKWYRYETPVTWWDMLKRDWAPAWFLKKYPARTIGHVFRYEQNIHICPHADVAWSDDRHLIHMKVLEPQEKT